MVGYDVGKKETNHITFKTASGKSGKSVTPEIVDDGGKRLSFESFIKLRA